MTIQSNIESVIPMRYRRMPITYIVIEWLANAIAIINFVPQAVQTLLTQSSKGLVLLTVLGILVGNIFLGIYGFLIQSYVIVIAAVVKIISSLIFIWFKYKAQILQILKAKKQQN